MSQASIATQAAAMKAQRVEHRQQTQERIAVRNADKANQAQEAGAQRNAADAQQAKIGQANAEISRVNRSKQAENVAAAYKDKQAQTLAAGRKANDAEQAAAATAARARQAEVQAARPKPSVNALGHTTGQIISVTA